MMQLNNLQYLSGVLLWLTGALYFIVGPLLYGRKKVMTVIRQEPFVCVLSLAVSKRTCALQFCYQKGSVSKRRKRRKNVGSCHFSVSEV